MSNIIMNAKSKAVAVAAGSNTTTVTKDVEVSTVTEKSAVDAAEAETVTDENEAALVEEAAMGETGEATAVDETVVDAVVEETTETVDEGVAIEEPAPIIGGGMTGDMGLDGSMYMEPGMETGMAEVKDPILSSWPFVIGISAAVLFVSIALGALLARRKIKKGIELYED